MQSRMGNLKKLLFHISFSADVNLADDVSVDHDHHGDDQMNVPHIHNLQSVTLFPECHVDGSTSPELADIIDYDLPEVHKDVQSGEYSWK